MKRLISTVAAVLAFGSLAAFAVELPAGYTAIDYTVTNENWSNAPHEPIMILSNKL